MFIGIDGNEANITTRVGVGQYAYNILSQLSSDKTNQYFVYLKNPPLPDMPKESSNWHYIVFGPSKYWTRFALPLKLIFQNIKLDFFYSPSHYSPKPAFVPTIPTIHDIGYLQNLNQFNKKDIYQLVNWTKDSLFQAKHIIAVSEFTKSELVKTYHLDPNKISVVYNGINPIQATPDKSVLQKFNITSPYFLSLGTLKPNKNYPFLIESFSKIKGNYQLVIAGKKGWLFDDIYLTVKKLNLESKVIFTDYITEIEKVSLLKFTECLIIPSTYEGFGIPAIEAQIVGTPVIAANIPSLKEILEDSAIFIDPHDLKSLTTAFSQIEKQKSQLIKKGFIQSKKFTWENSAKSLLEVFKKIS
jgi:glycosyltransferase involved in cell wall biosynthesis